MPSPAPVALVADAVGLGYHGHPVVHEATVELRRGAVTALVGPNGSGKSTLLRALARLHPGVDGTVTLADGGARLAGAKASPGTSRCSRRVAPLPVGVRVSATWSATAGNRAQVPRERPRWSRRGRARDGGHRRGSSMAERAVDELSGGELRRVWLATCLAQDTAVLLLDEPTTFLDLRFQVEVLDLVRDLADDHGVAVGVVLHDRDQAASVADTVVLLDRGGWWRPDRPRGPHRIGPHDDVRHAASTCATTRRRARSPPCPSGRHTHRLASTR